MKRCRQSSKELWAQANKISPWSGDFKIAYNADGSHKAWVDAVANQIKNTLGINAEGDSYRRSAIFATASPRTIATAFRSGWMLDYPSAEDYLTPLLLRFRGRPRLQRRRLQEPEVRSGTCGCPLPRPTSKRTSPCRKLRDPAPPPSIPLWCDNVAAVSAQNVKNVQFDYTNMPTYNTITK